MYILLSPSTCWRFKGLKVLLRYSTWQAVQRDLTYSRSLSLGEAQWDVPVPSQSTLLRSTWKVLSAQELSFLHDQWEVE